MEDKVFTTHVATGTLDMGGADRGTGTALQVHVVIEGGGTGTISPAGTFTVTLKTAATTPGTVAIQVATFNATVLGVGHKGVHAVCYLPYDSVLQFLTIDVNDTSLTGCGSAPIATAWVFAQ